MRLALTRYSTLTRCVARLTRCGVLTLYSAQAAVSQISGDYAQVPMRWEFGLLDECERQILRYAQDDNPAVILSVAKDLKRTYG